MCVICALPEGTKISEEEFERCWRANSAGFGFSYVNKDNVLVIDKAMELPEAKEKFFDTFEKLKDTTPFMLHWRIKTHGPVGLDNTHPFWIKDGKLAFCHNGTIHHCYPKGDDQRSDTRVFGDDYLKKLPDDFLENPPIMNMMAEFVNHSKLAFINNRRQMRILNMSKGETDEGRWFSNSSFRGFRGNAPTPTASPTTKSNYTPGQGTSGGNNNNQTHHYPGPKSMPVVSPHANPQETYRKIAENNGFLPLSSHSESTSPSPWAGCGGTGAKDSIPASPKLLEQPSQEVRQENHQFRRPKNSPKPPRASEWQWCKGCGQSVSDEEYDDEFRLCVECVMPYVEYLALRVPGSVLCTGSEGKGIVFPECGERSKVTANGKCDGIELDAGLRCWHWTIKATIASELARAGKVTIPTNAGNAYEAEQDSLTEILEKEIGLPVGESRFPAVI